MPVPPPTPWLSVLSPHHRDPHRTSSPKRHRLVGPLSSFGPAAGCSSDTRYRVGDDRGYELRDDVLVLRNRSVPPNSVTPVLTYPDVVAAVAWLTRVFGFIEHVRIGDHRAQLGYGDGALIVADASHGRRPPGADASSLHTQSVMVRVENLDAHYQTVVAAGATILNEPADHSYGERQYAVADLAGHRWMFTESIADVAPEDWGGSTVNPW